MPGSLTIKCVVSIDIISRFAYYMDGRAMVPQNHIPPQSENANSINKMYQKLLVSESAKQIRKVYRKVPDLMRFNQTWNVFAFFQMSFLLQYNFYGGKSKPKRKRKVVPTRYR